ncbi:MAG: DUF1848 domain-containing protein [Melioribacteraceae bacterium]|nr:DUF1848 domain-containing protein [Melioribacteraceae bacterium]
MTKKTIITVSRRTDIPAYYSDWFRQRLEIGYAFYPNPISQKPVFVDLSPAAVKAFVFWTRNPKPLFKHLDYIDERYSKHHYMHFTINGLPPELEKRNPSVDYAVSSAEFLAKRYGSDYLQWRFDPIVFSSISDETFVLKRFQEIAEKMHGLTKRCYFSFVDLYRKTQRNFKKVSKELNIEFRGVRIEEQIDFTKRLNEIASKLNITLYACAEDQLLDAVPQIEKAHCVDSDIIKSVCSDENHSNYKFEESRLGCGCIESKDVGYYDSCPHGCIYCYANMNPEKALENAKIYQKNGFPLDNEVVPQDRNNQINLFK